MLRGGAEGAMDGSTENNGYGAAAKHRLNPFEVKFAALLVELG